MARNIWEIEVDGQRMFAEVDNKGITFRKKVQPKIPFASICWQDVYSSAWRFAQIRVEYDAKTKGSSK